MFANSEKVIYDITIWVQVVMLWRFFKSARLY